MKPPEFDYVAPETLAEATAALRAEPDAKVLAGGQSLIPLLNFRLAGPALLVDLRRVPGLDRIEGGDGVVSIGAMTRQRDAEESELLQEAVPLLGEALRHVAHPQIRSRGTIGGSVAHADPAAELPAVLVALGGRVRAVSAAGERWVDADGLYTGLFTTALEPDEVLVDVELPVAGPRTGAACVEVARRAGDYAICGALAQVSLHDDGRIADACLALVGVGSRPAAAPVLELLHDEAAEPARLAEAARAAAADLEPVDDVQATAEYRRHLARVLGRRALEQAVARAA